MSELPYDPTDFSDALSQHLAGRYTFRKYLAHGGFGLVYVFDHPDLAGVQVAVKLLRPELLDELPDIRDAFEKEVTLLARCTHPNVIRIHDLGSIDLSTGDGRQFDQVPFYIMDFLDGYSELDKYLEQNIEDVSRNGLLIILRQVLSGVAHIHSRGIFHNDLKEANVFVSNDGVLVADFGWAKDISPDGKSYTTRTGTRDYMDPEILEVGEDNPDLMNPSKTGLIIPRDTFLDQGVKWDLYALGVTFERAMRKIREADPRKLSSRDITYLSELAGRLKSHDAEGYTSADEACEDLDKDTQTFGTELLVPELSPFPVRTRRIPPELSVPVTDRVMALSCHPAVLRLERIRQLGLAFKVYPGATHSRLEHSLGTFFSTVKYAQALLSGEHDPYFRLNMQRQDIDTLLAAALLHDIGHVPFAHAFEGVAGVPDHSELTLGIIRGEYDEAMPQQGRSIAEILDTDWLVDVQDVVAVLSKAEEPTTLSQNKVGVLRSILSGPVDADKMDYLQRDSLHAGVPYGSCLDRDRFLQSLRVHPEFKDRLAILDKGRVGADQFIQARYQMYSEVYWYHEVRAYESMLVAAVEKHYSVHNESVLAFLLESSDDAVLDSLATSDVGGVNSMLDAIARHERHRVADQYQERSDPDVFNELVRLRWHSPPGHFQAFNEALLEDLGDLLGHELDWWKIVVDVPNPERYRIGSLEVIPYDGRSPEPLSQVSFVWKSVEEDFQQWVQMARLFATPEMRESLLKHGRPELQKKVEKALGRYANLIT